MPERLSAQQVQLTDLAGEKIRTILTHVPGNGASVRDGRHLQDLCGELLPGADHLRRILEEAQTTVNDASAAVPQRSGPASNTNWEKKR